MNTAPTGWTKGEDLKMRSGYASNRPTIFVSLDKALCALLKGEAKVV